MVGFGSIFLIVGLCVFWFGFLSPVLQWLDARSWPTTEATILSSKIEEHDGDDGSTYSAEFTYTYDVDGQNYTNDRYTFLEISGSYKSAKKTKEHHPVGSKVVISYDPDDPQQAVMDNSMGWRLLFGLLPLVFIVVGAGIVWAGLVGWSDPETKRRRAMPAASNQLSSHESDPGRVSSLVPVNSSDDQKDLQFDGPQKLEPQFSAVLILFVAGIFTLIWNGVVSFLVAEVIEEGFPIFTTLFAIPFVLIGLGGFGFCLYALMAMFNPTIEVALSNGAVGLGEHVDVAWEVKGNAASIRRLSIIVQGQESATYRRGTDTITDTETFKKIEIVVTENTDEIQFGMTTIQIPADTMHSFDGGNNSIRWLIQVHGDIPRWPDVNQSMEFRVKPAAA